MSYDLATQLQRYVGQTVTIFTTSGGPSGCGFTGVLLFANPCFVRLVSKQGTPPAVPLAENICPNIPFTDCTKPKPPVFNVGAVCDIPVDKIASFCYNAI